MKRHNVPVLLTVMIFLIAATSCQNSAPQPVQPETAAQGSAEWDKYVGDFLDSYFVAHPDVAVLAGRHEFDGKLPDWSDAGLKKEIQRLHSERDRANDFKEAALEVRQRFERNYVVAQIDKDLFWLESADWPHKNPFYYSDSIDPDVYVSRDYAPLPVRMKAYTAYAKAVPAAVEQIRNNLKLPLPRTFVKIGRTTLGGLAEFYEKDVATVFASVTDQQLQSDFKAANAGAAKAMKDLDAWFASQESSATDNFALGQQKFSEMLKATEGVDVPLDQLEKIGRQDMDRNLVALREACAKFAPNQTIEQCVAKAQADKPEGNVLDAARQQLSDLKKFILEKNIVTIPGPEEAKVGEAPPYKRWNFAYINIPGPYEKGVPSIYYISPPDPSWPKEKRDEYVPGKGSLLFTSVHEVWPGHFLQYLHANRSPSKFGQVFVGYAFAEGWALYRGDDVG